MADIAKLGLVVEATGVEQARGQLQALAQTGELAGQKLVYLAGSADTASSATKKHVDISTTLQHAMIGLARETGAFGGEAINLGRTLAPTGPEGIGAVGGLVALAAAIKTATSESTAFAEEMTSVEKLIREGSVQTLTQHIVELKDVLQTREGIGGVFVVIAPRAEGVVSGGPGGVGLGEPAAGRD